MSWNWTPKGPRKANKTNWGFSPGQIMHIPFVKKNSWAKRNCLHHRVPAPQARKSLAQVRKRWVRRKFSEPRRRRHKTPYPYPNRIPKSWTRLPKPATHQSRQGRTIVARYVSEARSHLKKEVG